MDPIDETIQSLILNGAIEVVGIDSETGQFLYSFNQKIKEIMPELYKEHLTEVNRDIMYLWEQGFLDIDLLSNDPLVILTDKALDQEQVNYLSLEHKSALAEIKRLLLK
jgi:hypothetical protein